MSLPFTTTRALQLAPIAVWATMSPQSADPICTYSDVGLCVGDGLGGGVGGGLGEGVGLGDGEGMGVAACEGCGLALAVPPNGLQAADNKRAAAASDSQGRMGASLATGP